MRFKPLQTTMCESNGVFSTDTADIVCEMVSHSLNASQKVADSLIGLKQAKEEMNYYARRLNERMHQGFTIDQTKVLKEFYNEMNVMLTKIEQMEKTARLVDEMARRLPELHARVSRVIN